MQDELAQVVVPQWLEWMLWLTVAGAVLWLLLTLFVYARRRAANLTPVTSPDPKKGVAPDFLKVDHKARDAQIARGETYGKELDAREAAEAAAKAKAGKQVTLLQRLAGLATLLFSIFSLLSTAVGVIWQVDRIGSALSQSDKLALILQKYPIPFAVCVFVIGYYVVRFFAQKQWKTSPK
jgi:hypothetical protein